MVIELGYTAVPEFIKWGLSVATTTGRLSTKMELFCRELLAVDFNASQAAINAGYSKKTAGAIGAENLKKPQIQERIAELMQERISRVEIDADWVLMSAKKVFDRCMQEEAVIDRDGNETGQFKFEHSGANKSLEIIGRHVKVKAFDNEGANDAKATPINVTIGVKDCSVKRDA